MFKIKNEIKTISGEVRLDCDNNVGSKNISKEQGNNHLRSMNNSKTLGIA